MKTINNAVHELLNKIETTGMVSAPRGLQVKELEMQTLELDPNFCLMDSKARVFNFKYFLGEMCWYLKKDRNIEYINHFSNFWKNIADAEGNIHSNYGYMLFGEQLQWSLNALRKDPNTRQGISFVSRPEVQYEGNKDFVCTIYLNFWIRNNKLNMKVQMRSNDVFYGLSYDAPFFSFVQQSMFLWLKESYPDLILGAYYHSADNIHYYERHFDVAKQILEDEPLDPYFFKLIKPLFTLENGEMKLTKSGENMLADVDITKKITQEEAFKILSQYFLIK
jgi:thymidylate synthase